MEESESAQAVSILYVEEPFTPELWSIKNHTHKCYHMFYMVDGSGVYSVGSDMLSVGAGQCILVPPMVSHALKSIRDPDRIVVQEVLFSINDPSLDSRVRQLGVVVQLDDITKTLVSHIQLIGNTRVPHMKRAADCFMEAMLEHLCLSEEKKTKSTIDFNKQLIDISGFSALTASIIVYIDNNYTRRISLNDISASLGYNSSYMCTAFKKECGITINDYVNMVRINRVTQYLSYADADIASVCRACGFNNVSHFNRTFKQFLGVSPSIYKHTQPVYFNNAFDFGPESEIQGKIQTIIKCMGAIPVSEKMKIDFELDDK
jgi:AraC-like DNA-binding protein